MDAELLKLLHGVSARFEAEILPVRTRLQASHLRQQLTSAISTYRGDAVEEQPEDPEPSPCVLVDVAAPDADEETTVKRKQTSRRKVKELPAVLENDVVVEEPPVRTTRSGAKRQAPAAKPPPARRGRKGAAAKAGDCTDSKENDAANVLPGIAEEAAADASPDSNDAAADAPTTAAAKRPRSPVAAKPAAKKRGKAAAAKAAPAAAADPPVDPVHRDADAAAATADADVDPIDAVKPTVDRAASNSPASPSIARLGGGGGSTAAAVDAAPAPRSAAQPLPDGPSPQSDTLGGPPSPAALPHKSTFLVDSHLHVAAATAPPPPPSSPPRTDPPTRADAPALPLSPMHGLIQPPAAAPSPAADQSVAADAAADAPPPSGPTSGHPPPPTVDEPLAPTGVGAAGDVAEVPLAAAAPLPEQSAAQGARSLSVPRAASSQPPASPAYLTPAREPSAPAPCSSGGADTLPRLLPSSPAAVGSQLAVCGGVAAGPAADVATTPGRVADAAARAAESPMTVLPADAAREGSAGGVEADLSSPRRERSRELSFGTPPPSGGRDSDAQRAFALAVPARDVCVATPQMFALGANRAKDPPKTLDSWNTELFTDPPTNATGLPYKSSAAFLREKLRNLHTAGKKPDSRSSFEIYSTSDASNPSRSLTGGSTQGGPTQTAAPGGAAPPGALLEDLRAALPAPHPPLPPPSLCPPALPEAPAGSNIFAGASFLTQFKQQQLAAAPAAPAAGKRAGPVKALAAAAALRDREQQKAAEKEARRREVAEARKRQAEVAKAAVAAAAGKRADVLAAAKKPGDAAKRPDDGNAPRKKPAPHAAAAPAGPQGARAPPAPGKALATKAGARALNAGAAGHADAPESSRAAHHTPAPPVPGALELAMLESPNVNFMPRGSPAPFQYQMTPYRDSDSENSDDEAYRATKDVPEWAKSAAVKAACTRQRAVDADRLFGDLNKTCDLVELFGPPETEAKRKRFRTRRDTGDWRGHHLTWQEEAVYRKAVGWK